MRPKSSKRVTICFVSSCGLPSPSPTPRRRSGKGPCGVWRTLKTSLLSWITTLSWLPEVAKTTSRFRTFWVLAYVSGSITIEALKDFNPTESSFARGICYMYQDDNLFQPCPARPLSSSFHQRQIVQRSNPIMEPNKMTSFGVYCASAADGIRHTL